MLEIFSYPFIIRACIVGLLVSLSSALLGVPLVLRRHSMIGDGLSHVGFGALSVASVLSLSPMYFTIPVVALFSVLLLRMEDRGSFSDGMTAIISSSSLAFGTFIVSFVRGTNSDISNFLFGSVLAIGKSDAYLAIVLSILVLMSFVLLFPRIFSITFDPEFSKSVGLDYSVYMTILALLTSVTIVLGMRMMGSLLISAVLVFPALTAIQVAKSFLRMTILSGVLSIVSFTSGLCLSFYFGTPVGATVVLFDLVLFIIFHLMAKFPRLSKVH